MSAPDRDLFALGGYETDPVLDLIAEEARLLAIGCDFRHRADVAWFALGDERLRFRGIAEEDRPDPFGPLYAQAQEYEEAAGEVLDEIKRTAPTTIEGAIAQLALAGYETDELVQMALAGLRAIAKGGAA